MKVNSRLQKCIWILLLLLLVVAVVLFGRGFEPTITKRTISESKVQKLLASHNMVQQPLVESIALNGQTLLYDSQTATYYYSLVQGDSSAYNPTVVLEEKGADVYFAGPPVSDNLITANQPIQLLQVKGSDIFIANLICTSLPLVNISVDSQTMEKAALDEYMYTEEYLPMQLSLFDNRSQQKGKRLISSDGAFHIRGGTTASAEMSSYRLTLLCDKNDMTGPRKSVNLLGLREDDDWILYSGYSDYEKIRNVFSTNLWADMAAGRNAYDAPNSNRYEYVELFFNGHYHGLYALGYPIDAKQLKIKQGASEYLFKKKDWSTTESALEMEPSDSGYAWVPGYFLQAGDEKGYEYLHELYFDIAHSDDPKVIEAAGDVDNAIDLLLFYRLTQAIDNLYYDNVKNLEVAVKKDNKNSLGYSLLFAPWDMDQTWGNGYYDGSGSHGISSYCYSPDYSIPIHWSLARLAYEAGDEKIYTKLSERYSNLRQNEWSDERIDELIDKYQASIYGSGAFGRTLNRWPEANYNNPASGLEDFRNYVHERLSCMDKEVQSKSILED